MYLTHHQAIAARDTEAVVRELKDREEVIDALYRFGLGQDLHDRELFASAFSSDAELDFRSAAAKIGIESQLMTGRDTIVDTILGMFVRIHTTHVVTNCRVQLDGDTAQLTAIVEAQHLPAADHSRHALLKNRYAVDLVRDGERWVMRRVHIDNVWYTGNAHVILGQ